MDDAVFQVTIEALATAGLEGISLGGIAKAAGVGRPTIYLRWKDLHDLVVDALDWYAQGLPAPRPEGDELVDAVKSALHVIVPDGRRDLGLGIVGHVIADARRHQDLFRIVQERMVAPNREALVGVLERRMDEGVIRSDVSADFVADLIMGCFFSMFMSTGDVSSDTAQSVVDRIWPLIRQEGKAKVKAARRGAGIFRR